MGAYACRIKSLEFQCQGLGVSGFRLGMVGGLGFRGFSVQGFSAQDFGFSDAERFPGSLRSNPPKLTIINPKHKNLNHKKQN